MGSSNSKTKKKGFERHQEKYADKVQAFNLTETSGITECGIVDAEQREYKDVFFGGCYCLFSIIWLVIIVVFLSKGDISNSFDIYSSDNKQCGNGKDFFFITDLNSTSLDQILNSGVCVSKCPAKGVVTNCTQIGSATCPTSTYDSGSWDVLGSLCFPTSSDFIDAHPTFAQLKKKIGTSFAKFSPILIASFAFATILNLLYIKLMSAHPMILAKVSVWLVIILMLTNIVVAAALPFTSAFDNIDANVLTGAKIGCGVWAGLWTLALLIFMCVLCRYRDQFDIAIQIVDTAADFYNATLRLFFVSCFTFQFHLWSTVLLVLGYAYGSYVGQEQSQYKTSLTLGNSTQAHINFLTPDPTLVPVQVRVAIVFLTIQWIWINIFASQQLAFTTMYSAASYYFSSEGDLVVGSAQVTDGLKLSYTKHLGSVALGSSIHVVIQLIQGVIESAGEQADGPAVVLLCIVSCIMYCVEGAIEMLTKVAYANMAISGDKFCTSAWNGFMISLRHLFKFIVASKIAGFIVFMGSTVIFFSTMAFTYGVLTLYKDIGAVVTVVMCVAAGFIALITNAMFLGLFDEAILATLQCVAIDMDFNGGHPKYGSSSFQTNMQIILDREYDDKDQQYAPVVNPSAPAAVADNSNNGNNGAQQNNNYTWKAGDNNQIA